MTPAQGVSGDQRKDALFLGDLRRRLRHQHLQRDLTHPCVDVVEQRLLHRLELDDVNSGIGPVPPALPQRPGDGEGMVGLGARQREVDELDRLPARHHHPCGNHRVEATGDQHQKRFLGSHRQTTGSTMTFDDEERPMVEHGDLDGFLRIVEIDRSPGGSTRRSPALQARSYDRHGWSPRRFTRMPNVLTGDSAPRMAGDLGRRGGRRLRRPTRPSR